MPSPSDITSLTEQAVRIKSLLRGMIPMTERAKAVNDEFEETMTDFAGHLSTVSKNSAALRATMAEMGNATAAMQDAFRGDAAANGGAGETVTLKPGDVGELKVDAQGAVDAKPAETAHLPKVGAGNAA